MNPPSASPRPYHALRLMRCFRHETWLYQLATPISRDLVAALALAFALSFPLGEDLGFFRGESAQGLVTGTIGGSELQLTLKVVAGHLGQGRQEIEGALDAFFDDEAG